MRELTLAVADDDAAASFVGDVLLRVLEPELFVLSLLLRFPLLVGGGVSGGRFLTRVIVLNRALQQGHLFSVSSFGVAGKVSETRKICSPRETTSCPDCRFAFSN